MSVGSDWAVELAEQNGEWRTYRCVCCGEPFKVNITLHPHEEMCGNCKEKMNRPDKWDEKDDDEDAAESQLIICRLRNIAFAQGAYFGFVEIDSCECLSDVYDDSDNVYMSLGNKIH